jgi:hypothetical protein
MRLKTIQAWQEFFGTGKSSVHGPAHSSDGHASHSHVWDHALSRRQFILTAAGTTGLVFGAGLWRSTLAHASASGCIEPKPIPGEFPPGSGFHVFLPSDMLGQITEPSTITDFNGFIGQAHVQGTGKDKTESPLLFDADVRFMQGVFIGVDGRHHQGTFGFV